MKTNSRMSDRAALHRWSRGWGRLVCLGALLAAAPLAAQTTPVGGIARNVTMTDRATGQPVTLYSFADQVVLLDFFAYWCGPCQSSSPDVEQNIKKYYDARGGNAHGVPVAVIAVNIEDGNESATDDFIRNAGLEFVVNDYAGAAWGQFGQGYIPHFVIINGVGASPSHQQWEVLHSDSGYPGAAALRAIIDRVEASNPTAPPTIQMPPVAQVVPAGDTLRLEVRATGAPPLKYQWYRNDQALAGATAATFERLNAQVADSGNYLVEVRNDFGTARSAAVTVRVASPGAPQTYAYAGNPVNIPDANVNGITSQIQVNETLEVLRLKVSFRITHPYRGDLKVVLRAPSGQSVVLVEPNTGDSGANLIVAGRVVPDFMGLPARGMWRLTVSDAYSDDTGRLETWSLEITPPAPTLGTAFAEWIGSFPTLTTAQRAPDADPDGDGVLNIVEYVLNGHSPVVPAPGPKITPAAGASDYFEYLLVWRPGVSAQSCRVFLSENLGAAMQEAVTRGTDILVDRTDPSRLVVRCRRTLPRVFLQMRADVSGP